MNSLIKGLENLSLSDSSNKDNEIEELCNQMGKLVIEEEVDIDDLISEFQSLEIKIGKKIDNRFWNFISCLMTKQHCFEPIQMSQPRFVETF